MEKPFKLSSKPEIRAKLMNDKNQQYILEMEKNLDKRLAKERQKQSP